MENNNCMVSVLCTAFNHGKYIRQTLESFVTQQTDFPFEVLVNDDCSSDDTAEIIREYAEKYPHIIRATLQEKNLYSKGISIHKQVFYPQVRGKYIAFCEGDDFWCDPMKLQLQVDFLESHLDYSACVHNSKMLFCNDGDRLQDLSEAKEDRDIPFELIIKGMGNIYHTSSIMARSELIMGTPDFEAVAEKFGFTDYPIAIWLSMSGKVRFLERFMSTYRVASNPGSWTHDLSRNYRSKTRFINGEIAMFKALLPHLEGDWLNAARHELLEREFELMFIEGRVHEQVQPPYLEIYKSKDLKYRTKQFIKRSLPFLHNIYRKKKGYED